MIEFKTQGYARDEENEILEFEPNTHKCGTIKDGVGFSHKGDGWWTVSYEDLMKMADLATEARKPT